jgi:HEPN domain-containing protein
MARPRYISWLLQSESDLRSVVDLIKNGHFAQACFNAQQAAEKALNSLAFYRGADLVKSHSLHTIAKDLQINGELSTFATKLDIYYLTSRHPDALPEHAVPAENFDHTMATEAFQLAEKFLKRVKTELGHFVLYSRGA